MTSTEIDVVNAFVAAINRRNLHEICDLMTDDHPSWTLAAESNRGARR